MTISNVSLFYIIPIVIVLTSTIGICFIMRNYEYGLVIPWINALLFIIMGVKSIYQFEKYRNESIVLFIWCVVCSITSIGVSIFILICFTNPKKIKFEWVTLQKYKNVYLMSTFVPLSAVLFGWLNVCIVAWYPKKIVICSIILEFVNSFILIFFHKNLNNNKRKKKEFYVKMVLFIGCLFIFRVINELAFYWYCLFSIIYFIRSTILVIKNNGNFDIIKNNKATNISSSSYLRYVPAICGLLSSILLLLIDLNG